MRIDLPFILLMLSCVAILFFVTVGLRHKKRQRDICVSPRLGNWQGVPLDLDDGIVSEVRIVEKPQKSYDFGMESAGLGGIANEIEAKQPPKKKSYVNPESLMIINVMAMPGQMFVGYEMLQALLALGFRYGEMNIFHRYEENYGKGRVLFSLASAVEPGVFDLTTIGGLSCAGLTLFMDINAHEDALAVFDLMQETAEQLADDLGGILTNIRHEELTAEAIMDCRDRLSMVES